MYDTLTVCIKKIRSMAKGIRYTPPADLEQEAKDYISEVVKELNRNNNSKKVDIAALDMLATSYSRYIQARKTIAEQGITFKNKKGEWVKHPAVNIEKDALNQTMRIASDYGLTLKSRESMSVTKSGDKEVSPLDEFAKGGLKP